CADPALAALPGRFLFAVDDGSGLALDQPADVALVARAVDRFELVLGGWSAGFGGARDAVDAAAAFLSLAEGHGWRIGELPDGPARVASRLGRTLGARLAEPVSAPLVPGRVAQRDGRFAVTALAPLGRVDGDMLAALGRPLRIGSGRTIT